MRSLMIVCLVIPRLALIAALGGRRELLTEPVALAPEAGREQRIGEVSAAAEAFGVAAGMGVGEALTRCPELRLVAPDPEAVRGLWARVLDRLEGIGASVESDRPAAAFFVADGLRGIHGGDLAGVLAATRRAFRRQVSPRSIGARSLGSSDGPLGPPSASPRPSDAPPGSPGASPRPPSAPPDPTLALAAGVRIGAGPSRFVAHVAASRARAGGRARGQRDAAATDRRDEVVVSAGAARSFLAPVPVAVLRARPELDRLPDVLERLGIRTLGMLADLPAPAVAERFGYPGLLALDLAQGRDTPLDPRRPSEPVTERVALPDAVSGPQLERALEMLVARLLSRRERRARTLRSLVITARLVEGGTWRRHVTLRRASADPIRINTALAPRLSELPAPAESLGLEAEGFGPPAHDQGRLADEVDPRAARRARIGEAVNQVRRAAGDSAALRVMDVDPDSRVPERRSVLAPYPVEGES